MTQFLHLFKKIYYIKFDTKEPLKPANDRAKLMMAKIEEERLKNPRKEKQYQDIMSIISGVANKSKTINYFNIWRLSIYQLWDAYYRLGICDNYMYTMNE